MPLLTLSKLKQSNFFICIFTLAYYGLSTIMYKLFKTIFSSYHLLDLNKLPLLAFIPSPPSSSIDYPSFVAFTDTVILWIIHPNLIASPLTSLEISPPFYMTFLEHWHSPPAYAHDYFFKIQFIFLHTRIFLNEI